MESGAGTSQAIRYLDGELERRALIEDIHRIRHRVISLAEAQPESTWYEPRYHGWSLAAMLMHLHTVDQFALMQIKLALVNIPFSFSTARLHNLNALGARWFQRRVVPVTIKQIRKHEAAVADFILHLPMDKFTKTIVHPPTQERLTVEVAVQQYFLFHWQEHYETLRGGHGSIYYEPPTSGIDQV